MGQLSGPIPTEVGLMAALTFLCVHERAPPCNGPFPGVRIHTAIDPPNTRAHFPTCVSLPLRFRRHARSVMAHRDLTANNLVGPIPTEVGLMTALTTLCVHERAPPRNCPDSTVPAHPAYPSFTRAHLAKRSSSPLRSSTRTQVMGQQRARGADPHRSGTDDGAHTHVRARACDSRACDPPTIYLALTLHSLISSLRSPTLARTVSTRRTLTKNQLSGPIPTEVGLMTALQYMCVHTCAPPHNRLYSATPHAPCDSPALRALTFRLTHLLPALAVATLAPCRHAGYCTLISSQGRSPPKWDR